MQRILLFALFTVCVFMAGMPIIMAQGSEEEREPASITIDPIAAVNPVKTQHTFVATVLDKNGRPLSGQRVEWILARHPNAVGDIVEHDDMGAIIGGSNEKVEKIANNYSVSYTNKQAVVLDKGTPSTADDVKLGVGQTWVTITSPVEGETHVIAFCPAIRNAQKHKAFAVKYWIDANIEWPEDAVNKVGTPHTFTFKLTKASNNAPLTGYRLRWTLEDNPDVPAYLGENKDTKVIESETNEEGKAIVVLNQAKNVEGNNKVKMELRKPTGELLAIRSVTKEWISPKITIQKTGPEEGILKEKVVYTINISNPGQADANDVVVKDTLPAGLAYLEATPAPSNVEEKILTWNIGVLAKDATQIITLVTRAEEVGTQTNTVTVTSREAAPRTGMAVTVIGAPELYLIKEGPAELRKGQIANYTVTLKNNGNAIARDVFIRDSVPSGMKYKNFTTGTTIRWNIGELGKGESRRFDYSLETPNVGDFINEAHVFMKNKEGAVHKTSWKTRVVAPDIKITKKGQSLIFLNKPAEYIISIVNEGTGSAKDMVLVDILPKYLDYISTAPKGIFKPAKGEELATITWKLGDIQPKQEINIKLNVRANATGRCTNTAKLRSDSQEPPSIPTMEASYDTTIMGVPAMHINSYDTEDPVEVGKQTIYVVETRNEGTSSCTNVIMTDYIDDEMEFVSASGPTGFKIEGNKVSFEPVPILQPGEKLTFKYVVKAVKEGSSKNKAVLKYDQFTKEIIDEEGTSVYK